ncbi:MAG: GTP-binding protein, partial [Lachnospiraceae bacterium]|nr:GTP-binding protein [Lachnospiraceae bacterium]
KSSIQQLNGTLTYKIKDLREKIIYETAFIESALDDPEHISLEGYGERILDKVKSMNQELDRMIASYDNGSILREGIDTLIIGKPNAGKSTLMNALLKKERAIVTDIAGTTRDVLEESIQLNGISLNIKDTAGIRDTEDIIEKIGVDKAKSYIEDADLILYVVDASIPLDKNDASIMELIAGKKCIVLLNKSDLETQVTEQEITNRLDTAILSASAREGDGIEELEAAITKLFLSGEILQNEEVYITNIRHKDALIQARESLKLVEESIESGMPEDFYSIDLMNAYVELGNIIGESVGENLVNEIFQKFCMGK